MLGTSQNDECAFVLLFYIMEGDFTNEGKQYEAGTALPIKAHR